MNVREIFEYYWFMNTPALLAALGLIALHYFTNGFHFTYKSILFFDGIILFLIATCSPLDYLGHTYLFSAHMAEHVILLLVVPPLILSGTEGGLFKKLVRLSWLKKIAGKIFHPAFTWFAGVGIMWLWHVPALFKAMNYSHSLHILNMLSLLIAGIVFIWPVYSPVNFRKLKPLQSVIYLFLACVGCSVLGILITFAPEGIYTYNTGAIDPGLYNYIHLNLRVTDALDQQTGGLIMWVPACIVYLANIMIILMKWFQTPEEKYSRTYYPELLNGK